MDAAKRVPLLKEYQQWCHDHVPTAIIRQEIQIFAMDIAATGWDNYMGFQRNMNNVTLGAGVTSAVIAQPGDYVDFNPLQSNSYYDFLIVENTHPALARRRGEYNLTHAVPWLAESWTHSADFKKYTVKMREGIKWEDGTAVTADDVVFSYHMAMDEDVACPSRGYYLDKFGNTSAVYKGATDYEVIFDLPKPYPYFETETLTQNILQKAEMSAVAKANWKTDDTNTKRCPKAFGPYMWDATNTKLPDTVVLKVNPNFDYTKWGHDPNMVGGGNWFPAPTLTSITYKVVKDATTAVAGLKSGTYDFIDSQMGIQAQAQDVNVSTWGKITRSYEWGYQEMGINHMNPIFGMNAKDPREMYPEDYAQAPFDLTAVFFAILMLASIQIIRNKKKK
jgi:ABC-type transport system substrate-binding protein